MKETYHISGPIVPHAKNQPPRSKTVAYIQKTESEKVKKEDKLISSETTISHLGSFRFSSMSGPIKIIDFRVSNTQIEGSNTKKCIKGTEF